MLSKCSKSFKVFSRPGGHISQIEEDVKSVVRKGDIDCKHVSSVFLVCGGNDIENLPNKGDLDKVFQDYKSLCITVHKHFPNFS